MDPQKLVLLLADLVVLKYNLPYLVRPMKPACIFTVTIHKTNKGSTLYIKVRWIIKSESFISSKSAISYSYMLIIIFCFRKRKKPKPTQAPISIFFFNNVVFRQLYGGNDVFLRPQKTLITKKWINLILIHSEIKQVKRRQLRQTDFQRFIFAFI